jgi:SRSO17 transposase
MLDNRMQCMPGDEVWLVGKRRSTGEQKYYVSNLPTDTSLKILAATIKARWVCEQAHQQLKEELGLRAAGRKKSRGTAATTEHAGHQASCPRSLRTAFAQAMPSL